jgi:hypothetical protein
MNLRSIAIVAALGLASALAAVGSAEAAHRDRDHGRRYDHLDHRSSRSYRGYSRAYRPYRPYVAYRPRRLRRYVQPYAYDYVLPYGYGYAPYAYAPDVPYRPYCRPRLRIGIGFGW